MWTKLIYGFTAGGGWYEKQQIVKDISAAETAVKDVDIINLWMDAGGAFALLASAAATINYLTLKQQPAKIKVQKKVT